MKMKTMKTTDGEIWIWGPQTDSYGVRRWGVNEGRYGCSYSIRSFDSRKKAVAELQAKQTAILDSAARLVKSGGRLVYATCSVLPQENEDIALAFGLAHPDFVPLNVAEELVRLKVDGAAGLCAGEGQFLRLWPHRHGTDGFFAAAWVKK